MNTANITNSSRPWLRTSVPPLHVSHSSAAAADMSTAFSQNWLRFIAAGRHTSDIPIMSPIFAVTEPTALPTAISSSPPSTPVTDTVSSGRVVARLTTVAPIINLGIPVAFAIHTAESTNQSPPLIIRRRPRTNSATTIIVSICPQSSPSMSGMSSVGWIVGVGSGIFANVAMMLWSAVM